MTQTLFDQLLPSRQTTGTGEKDSVRVLLDKYGFDRQQHEQIRQDLLSGRIGLAQNRLPITRLIEDAQAEEVDPSHRPLGLQALADGQVAIVSLAGGIGTRWTRGAGVVKALNPFSRLGGQYRSFIEVHLAKSLRIGQECGVMPPHVITTSYLTHEAIADKLASENNYEYP